MSGLLIVPNYMPALDQNGRPYNGAAMYFYLDGTTTPTTVYQDASLTVPHANPVVSDNAGVFPLIYASATVPVTVTVTTPTGIPLETYENIYPSSAIPGVPLTVPTRTAMKAISPLVFKSVVLTEAGRQGTFVAIAGSPPRTDTQEGVYVVSNTSGWYWSRIYAPSAYPSVTVFGALGGTNNDTVAVQASIDVLDGVDLSLTGSITGWTFGGITLANNQKMTANTKARVTSTAQVGGYVVRVRAFGIGTYAVIENLQFDLAAADDASTAIRFGTGTASVFGARIRGCDFLNCGRAIGDEVHATNYVVDLQITDCIFYFTRDLQVYFRRTRGFITLRDVRVDHTYNTGQVTWGAFRFDDLIGLELEKMEVTGPVQPTGIYQSAAVGLFLLGTGNGTATVFMTRVEIDNTRGPGIVIQNIQNVYAINTCVYQNLGTAIDLQSVSNASFANTTVVGGVGLTGAPASANGVSMSSCTNVKFSNLDTRNCTGDGNVMVSCTDCTIDGGFSGGNTGYGYRENTAATRNIRSNVRSIGNTAGSLLQIGTNSATVNWTPNTGTFTASTVGAATI